MSLVVVGNGHVSREQRRLITLYSVNSTVVRFNDMNSYITDEPVDIHVKRLPSAFPPLVYYEALEWYVSYTSANVPGDMYKLTLVYEVSRNGQNVLRNTASMFSNCSYCKDGDCRHNRTIHGPSTGGIILSELQADSEVDTLYVFGMNWMGGVDHVDFADPWIVRNCCTKCIIHETPDNTYGNEWNTLNQIMMMCAAALIFCVCVWRGLRRKFRNGRERLVGT